MKIIISDYMDNKKEIEIQKIIKNAFMIVISGDQILHVLYEDGTQDVFEALDDFRTMDFYDGGCFIDLDKAVDDVLDLSEVLK